MSKFVTTDTILDKIMAHKVMEVENAKKQVSISHIREQAESATMPRDFINPLQRDTVALIAEVKKASPSKGVLMPDFDYLQLANTYSQHGASAISVLTDEKFFQGHLNYLKEISQTVDIPTLRKDFIMDAYQVYEARSANAAAVLLIVATLEDSQLADLYSLIHELGMVALVEVHNEAELERAMRIEASLIGINNRDLKTFNVDLETTERIANLVPKHVTLVAESGLKSPDDIVKMGMMGAHAVLVGEGLVTSGNIAETVRQFANQKRVYS